MPETREDEAHTVLRRNEAGELLIAAGTIQWSWALDAFGHHKDAAGRETPVDPRIQALTQNMVRALVGGGAGPVRTPAPDGRGQKPR